MPCKCHLSFCSNGKSVLAIIISVSFPNCFPFIRGNQSLVKINFQSSLFFPCLVILEKMKNLIGLLPDKKLPLLSAREVRCFDLGYLWRWVVAILAVASIVIGSIAFSVYQRVLVCNDRQATLADFISIYELL